METANLKIQQRDVGNNVSVIAFEGVLDSNTYTEVEEFLARASEQPQFLYVFNMSGVTYVSSAGAGSFIHAHSIAEEKEGRIVLVGVQPDIKDVFDLLGLSMYFEYYETDTEATQALQAG